MNDKDGHGLKFDKVRPTFSCYNCKNYQLRLVLPNVICLNLLHNSTRVFFLYGLRHYVMTSGQNWPETAISFLTKPL